MQNQFEKLAKELNDAMAVSGGAGGGGGGNAQTNKTTTAAAPVAFDSTSDIPSPSNARADATNTTANFQDRIMQTMERMKTSNAEVDAGLAEPGAEDFLSEMLKQMGGGGENSGEEDFSNMLVNMMEQLTSKEILYEPMKELFEKYPEWLRKNEGKESQEDMDRYRKQFRIVKEIVTKFDEPGYRDEDESQREYIIERMQMVSIQPIKSSTLFLVVLLTVWSQMQTAGAPPTELMGDMNPGQPPDPASDCAMQ
jgi:peroxin-19